MLIRKITAAALIAALMLTTACLAQKGSIVILENIDGKVFRVNFNEWSEKGKCELNLKQDDVLQIEVARDDGEIGMTISGKGGSEPYTGNNLQSGIFTVTISETDDYVIRFTGENATGNVTITKLGDKE